jgi:hypothetical protein
MTTSGGPLVSNSYGPVRVGLLVVLLCGIGLTVSGAVLFASDVASHQGAYILAETSCATNHLIESAGTVKNTGDRDRDFHLSVRFLDSTALIVDRRTLVVGEVGPGERAAWDVRTDIPTSASRCAYSVNY